MSNDKAIARTFKLWAKVAMMIVDGKRDAVEVANVLQGIVDQTPPAPLNLMPTTQSGIAVYDHGDHFRFTLPATDGTTGEEWIARLESKGFRVGDYAKQLLRSPDFKPTSGVAIEVAVLKGALFKDNDRITNHIRAEAEKRKLLTPNAELACLIRELFTDKEIEEMGLRYIVAMHEPINDSDGSPRLLGASRVDGGSWLRAYYDGPGIRWHRDVGFAFAARQVGS